MKIVYFDYWTKGIKRFLRLNGKLKDAGHDTMLLHTGSARCTHVPKEEIIQGVLCRDISYYETNFIFDALSKIDPDVLLSINTTYLFDRALILACKNLNIRSVFLMNGDKPAGARQNEFIDMINKRHKRFYSKLFKVLKYAKFYIPNYLNSLVKHSRGNFFNQHPLLVLLSYYRDPGFAYESPIYPEELIHDRCLVFSNAYIPYYEKIGYKKEQISVVGNPEYEKLLLDKSRNTFDVNSLPEDVKRLVHQKSKYAVYLEEANVEHMIPGWSNDVRNHHLDAIGEALKKQSMLLVVKLHPLTSRQSVNVKSDNILIYDTCTLHVLIKYSLFCISHMSSTINIPVLLDKPIIIPQWGISREMPDWYLYNGVGNRWNNIEDKIDFTVNQSAREIYLKKWLTVMEAGSIDKIAEIVTASMVR